VQAVFGLERLVDSTIAKKVPAIAYGTTIAIRFVNNVIGESRGGGGAAAATAAADPTALPDQQAYAAAAAAADT